MSTDETSAREDGGHIHIEGHVEGGDRWTDRRCECVIAGLRTTYERRYVINNGSEGGNACGVVTVMMTATHGCHHDADDCDVDDDEWEELAERAGWGLRSSNEMS
eukprot:5221948-Pyramimonas_sp.AAC.1